MRPRRRGRCRQVRNSAGQGRADQLRQPDPGHVPRGDPGAPARPQHPQAGQRVGEEYQPERRRPQVKALIVHVQRLAVHHLGPGVETFGGETAAHHLDHPGGEIGRQNLGPASRRLYGHDTRTGRHIQQPKPGRAAGQPQQVQGRDRVRAHDRRDRIVIARRHTAPHLGTVKLARRLLAHPASLRRPAGERHRYTADRRSRCATSKKPHRTLIQEPRCATTGPGQPGPARYVHRRRVHRRRRPVDGTGCQLRLAATAARRSWPIVRSQRPKPMAVAVTDRDLKVNGNRCFYVLSRRSFGIGGETLRPGLLRVDKTGRGRSRWRAGFYQVTVSAGRRGVPGRPADRFKASTGAAADMRARPSREVAGQAPSRRWR
jgi:hypothetical protein